MNQKLIDYIKQGREKGLKDEAIKNSAILAGWDAEIVAVALKADLDAPAPPPPPASQAAKPIAVVHTFTARGLEYIIMFIALGVSAIALALLLHSIVDTALGSTPFYNPVNMYSTAALIVALPIFAILFLRLKSAELKDTTLLHDPSRRHAVQLTLIVTFIIGIVAIIGYIYDLLSGDLNTRSPGVYGPTNPFASNLLHLLITVGISCGIFSYYWHDSHKKDRV